MTGQQVLWDEAVSFPSTIATATPVYWVSVGERVKGSADVSRGRQYESDQQQTGQYRPTLINTDGALSPVNTAGQYYPNVLPRRAYRKRYQYPVTQNLLTGDQATMGETTPLAAGTLVTAFGMLSTDAAAAVVASGTAFQGGQLVQASIPNATPAGIAVLGAFGASVHPGQSHAFSGRVRVTSGTSPSLRSVLVWVDTNGAVISTVNGSPATITSGSSTWIQLSVAATPPANAAGMTCAIVMATLAGGAFVAQVDGFQLELAAAPTTFTAPGVWYPVLTGWTDRWPISFDKNGTYTLSTPTVLDAFAVLSTIFPPPPFYNDVLATSPTFFFPLDDPALSVSCRELTGNILPAPVVNSPQGAGDLQLGSGGTTGATPAGSFLGAPGPTATFNNIDNHPATPTAQPGTWIELDSVGIQGPPVNGTWTRMFAFQASQVPSNTSTIWSSNQPSWQVGGATLPVSVGAYLNPASGSPPGSLEIIVVTSSTLFTWTSAGNLCDGQWHLVFLTSTTGGTLIQITVDLVTFTVHSGAAIAPAVTLASDTLGETVLPGNLGTYQGLQANIGFVAQWPVVLTLPQMTTLYDSWRPGWSPEPSGERYQRILAWANYPGAQIIQGGNTLDMGPANDVDGRTDALTLLQNVVTTENGNHFVRADGTIFFEQRGTRYNLLTPTFIFGANVGAGEFPFADLGFDHDLDHVANQAEITISASGQVMTVGAAASQAEYGTLTLQRTVNVVNPQEGVDAATYAVNRYGQPLLRVTSITLAPARYSPDGGVTFPLWAVCGQLEISTRIRVNLRQVGQLPTATPFIQFDGFVESIAWTVDAGAGDTLVVLQVSPADLNLYWVLSALHTTVHTLATAGTNTVVLDALPDSASNPASASFCSGLQMTLDPTSPALTETLTVLSFSPTAPGYTTFTVTFTANLAHNHAVGSVAVEKLGVGQTLPAAWDPASILGTTTTLAY